MLRFSDIPETDALRAVPEKEVASRDLALTGTLGTAIGQTLATALPKIIQGSQHDLISEGNWSLHQFLSHVLHLIGPSEVWLCSWGISTKPLQAVADHVRQKRITRLYALFDHRVRLQCPQAFQLLIGLAELKEVDVRLTKIHAKIILLKGAHHALVLKTSANLTVNPRIETYDLRSCSDSFDFHQSWFNRIHGSSKPITSNDH